MDDGSRPAGVYIKIDPHETKAGLEKRHREELEQKEDNKRRFINTGLEITHRERDAIP